MFRIWSNFNILENKYKKLFYIYFKNKTCERYQLFDNYIVFEINNWGIEKVYHTFNSKYDNMYKLIYDSVIEDNDPDLTHIAVCVQIGNWDTFLKMKKYLSNFTNDTTFYFVIINNILNEHNDIPEYIKKIYKKSVIITADNKGMDIGLFLINYYYLIKTCRNYKYLFKVHTKTADNFRDHTLRVLMYNKNIIYKNISILNRIDVGMVAGNNIHTYYDRRDLYDLNMYHIKKSINYIYKEDVNLDLLEFVEGTMFMFKMSTFDILTLQTIEKIYNKMNNISTIDINWYSIYYRLNINDLEYMKNHYSSNIYSLYGNNIKLQKNTDYNDLGIRDFMIEHGYERLFGYMCKKNNLKIIYPNN